MTVPNIPPVTVILDPHDDATHTHTALYTHHPPTGSMTVHPTPATTSATTLAYDILAALDKPVPFTRPRGPGISETELAWATAAAWILTASISRLTLLRAHLLSPPQWQHLLVLREHTGVRLHPVCHRSHIPTALTRALNGIPHRLADATALLPPTDPTDPAVDDAPTPAPGWRANRWINVPALAGIGRTTHPDERARPRCRCAAPPATTRTDLPRPPHLTPATITEIVRRLHAETAHPQPAAAVATAMFTAAPDAQLARARATDLSDAADTLTLHNHTGRHNCATHTVPHWARPLLIAARHLTWIASGVSAPLFVTPGGLPGVLPEVPDLAARCKLRTWIPEGHPHRPQPRTRR